MSIINRCFKGNWRKIISPVVIVLIWEASSRLGWVVPYMLPPPTEILQTFIALLSSGTLMPHILSSLMRSLSGFVIGSALGIVTGMMIGWSRLFEDIADIPLQALRAVPKSALVPLIIIWLGLGEISKIFIVALPGFFMCLINTTSGVKGVDTLMIKAALSLGANNRQILREIVLPSALPMIFAGLRLGIVVSLVLLVIAEMVAADRGLGFFILESQRLWLVKEMFAGIITMSIIGFGLDRIMLIMESRMLKWHKGKTMGTH